MPVTNRLKCQRSRRENICIRWRLYKLILCGQGEGSIERFAEVVLPLVLWVIEHWVDLQEGVMKEEWSSRRTKQFVKNEPRKFRKTC